MSTVPLRARMGQVGIWSIELRFGEESEVAEAAAEIEELGFGAIWIPGALEGGVLSRVETLAAATRSAVIAAGVLNIYKEEPRDIGAWWRAQAPEVRDRVLIGLGVSHGPVIGENWGRPIETMRDYLDRLGGMAQPSDSLCLAALGPRMLELARGRTLGAHPYLVPPEHTAFTRRILGPDKLLAPEQGIILHTDPGKARDLGRAALGGYRQLPNYVNNWRRMGYSEEEIAQLSDRLVDGIFAWGGMDQIFARVKAHIDAGADHVCLQVIKGPIGGSVESLRGTARQLAEALF